MEINQNQSKAGCVPRPPREHDLLTCLTVGFSAGVAATLAAIKLISAIFSKD